MEDNKIIKVLECCAKMNCKKCPKPDYFKEFTKGLGCNNAICRQALELIKRQQAVIERLNNNMDAMVKEHNNLMKTIKEDIIREFEEKVKAKMTKYNEADGSYSFNVLTIEDITLIANELTGGEK